MSKSATFFGIRQLTPFKQFLIVSVLGVIGIAAFSNKGAEGDGAWLAAVTILALFAWMNPIINSLQSNPGKKQLISVGLFLILYIGFFFLANSLSVIKFGDLTYIQLLFVVVVFFFILAIMATTIIRGVYKMAINTK